MVIVVYQHGAGDFKVSWHAEDGGHGEMHFMFDMGGAISFALGLKCGALDLGEPVTLSCNLEDPRTNRGFYEGFRRGRRDKLARREDPGYTSHERTESPGVPNLVAAKSLCQVIRESVH